MRGHDSSEFIILHVSWGNNVSILILNFFFLSRIVVTDVHKVCFTIIKINKYWTATIQEEGSTEHMFSEHVVNLSCKN